MAKESVARALIDHVVHDRSDDVERCLREGHVMSWRHIVRYELPMTVLLADTPSCGLGARTGDGVVERMAAKLLAYEVVNISALHCAALLGRNDCLMSILDRDVPVDTPLSTGTTPLHLASYGGHQDTVRILISVHKAEVDRQDRYGWTALHYAATEGQMEVARILMNEGADVNKKDQDGTTAAYRAQHNGFSHLVTFLCQYGPEDELLNIHVTHDHTTTAGGGGGTAGGGGGVVPTYAVPSKRTTAQTHTDEKHRKAALAGHAEVLSYKQTAKHHTNTATPSSTNVQQQPHSHSGRDSARANGTALSRQASTHTLRRVIRKELEQAFGLDDDYMEPTDVTTPSNTAGSEGGGEGEERDAEDMSNIGMKTLSGLMRQELDKYRQQIIAQLSVEEAMGRGGGGVGGGSRCDAGQHLQGLQTDDDNGNNDYDDLYATLSTIKMLPPAPQPPAGPLIMPQSPGSHKQAPPPPPLPPRNSVSSGGGSDIDACAAGFQHSVNLTPAQGHERNAALTEALYRVSCLCDTQWKRLAHALPIDITTARVSERVMAIETQHAGDVQAQARVALAEWRINTGAEDATLDALIIALRKAELHYIIDEVERVQSEFTA